jgi:hypothetical protein
MVARRRCDIGDGILARLALAGLRTAANPSITSACPIY